MEQFTKIIEDLGIYVTLMLVVLYLGFKYIPKYLEVKIKRMEEKDYMLDSFKAVVENNSQVINNNSEVIKLNSSTIKNYTDNSYKLEKHFNELANEVRESNKLIQSVSANIEILKERR